MQDQINFSHPKENNQGLTQDINKTRQLENFLRRGLKNLSHDEIDQLFRLYNDPTCIDVYLTLASQGIYISVGEVTAFLASKTQSVRRVVISPEGDTWTSVQPDSNPEQSPDHNLNSDQES